LNYARHIVIERRLAALSMDFLSPGSDGTRIESRTVSIADFHCRGKRYIILLLFLLIGFGKLNVDVSVETFPRAQQLL
jgi:hypothetical protein